MFSIWRSFISVYSLLEMYVFTALHTTLSFIDIFCLVLQITRLHLYKSTKYKSSIGYIS